MVMGHCDVQSFLAPPTVAPLHVEICIRAYTDVVSMLSAVFHWNAMQICRLLSVHVICPYTRQRAFYGIKRAIFFENELFRFRLRDRKTRDKNSRIIVVQRTYSIIICRVVRLYAWFNPNKRNALPVWLHVTNADPIPTSDRISFFLIIFNILRTYALRVIATRAPQQYTKLHCANASGLINRQLQFRRYLEANTASVYIVSIQYWVKDYGLRLATIK